MARPIWVPPHLVRLFRNEVLQCTVEDAANASDLLAPMWVVGEQPDRTRGTTRRSWMPGSILNRALKALQPTLYDAPRITIREVRSLPGAVITIPEAARWMGMDARTWRLWEEDRGFAPRWLPLLYEASANVLRGSTAAARADQRAELASLCAQYGISRAEFGNLVHNPARGGDWLSGRVAMPPAELDLFRRICADRAAVTHAY